MSNEEKTCWICKRVLVGKSTLRFCPDCVNKYGTPVAAMVLVGGGLLLKNGGKIIKTVAKTVKY